ncbi:Helicase [Macleaya cordata]|uniref:DNA 3'-5' helicase n=1 Tax=Macleaya cordata TaxID=56857 RepID=A0A200QY55_MACCD|nr:Helicase [Macleaya cordata]
MEIDSDSDGSHISATPPREEESKPSKTHPLLSLVASYKPKTNLKKTSVPSRSNQTRVPSRSNPKSTSNRKPPKSKSKTPTLTQTQPQPHEENASPNPLLSPPDFSNLPGFPVPIRGSSDRNHEVSSVKTLPARFSPKFSSYSSIGRSFSNPEPTEKDPVVSSVSIPLPEIGNSDHIEVAGNGSYSVTPEISGKSVHGGDCVRKPLRKHPNSIGGANTQPLPSKKPKSGSEGNFVRLNINGYGRSKFVNKKGKRYNSNSSQSRRSRWRSKRKSKAGDEAESNGICEEDGLVSEIPKQQEQCEKSELGYEMIERAVMDARDDPSDGNLLKLLKLSHGYDSFREGQLEAIKNVVTGKSTALVLPTGAGKSLCYQLPALILPGLTLVVSPLVALMVDQLRQLPPMIQGGLLSSSQGSEEASDTIRRLIEGNIKVLFVSPERFLNAEFLSIFGSTLRVSLVVIDEAHCLSEWSHNFRPSYLRLRASLLREKLNAKCFLAMTATATTKTLQAIMCALEIPPTSLIQTSQMRENFQLSVTLSGNLMLLMKSSPFTEVTSTIIYCKFQSETDLLSKYLCDNNISAKSYHSGIPAKDRSRIQELFCSNKIRVVVATVAFGMGLNKSDVGAVIHYSLPESLEEYVQEIGRAGRDGRLSYCHLFFDDSTYFKLRSFSYSDGVDEYAVNKFLCQVFSNALNSPGKIFSLVKESASQKFDMKDEVIITVLTYLEIGEVQYLRLLPQLNVTCTLYFHKVGNQICSQIFSGSSNDNFRSEAKQGAYVFDIPAMANSIGVTAIDLSNHLQNLKFKGEITYEVKDLAFCYMVVKTPGDFCSLAAHLTKWLSEVESCKVKKLDVMYNAATFAAKVCEKVDGCSGTQHTKCLQSRIMDYFSREDDDPQCDFSNKMGRSSPFLRADIKVFLQSNSHAKFTPRAVARIMHGIPSPAYPSSTWSKTHFWGRYSQIDFPVVIEAATAELMNFAGKHVCRYKERRWDAKQLIGSGGMPSSHSATVTALALAVGFEDGFGGTSFATAMIFACVVMHDALGVRLHAGRQAEVLNQIVFELPAEHPLSDTRPLRELIGHTPPQVLAGLMLGLVTAVIAHLIKAVIQG